MRYKIVQETYLVSVQSCDGRNALDLQDASWEFGSPQHVGQNLKTTQIFGYKAWNLGSPGNSKYFYLLECRLFVVEPGA